MANGRPWQTDPATPGVVYLLHFLGRGYRAPGGRYVRHKIGVARMTVEQFQHAYQTDPNGPSKHGLMRALHLSQGDFELVRLWACASYLEAHKWKSRVRLGLRPAMQCPRCAPALREQARKPAAARYAKYLIRTGGRPRRHKGTRRLQPWQPSRTVLEALAWDAARRAKAAAAKVERS